MPSSTNFIAQFPEFCRIPTGSIVLGGAAAAFWGDFPRLLGNGGETHDSAGLTSPYSIHVKSSEHCCPRSVFSGFAEKRFHSAGGPVISGSTALFGHHAVNRDRVTWISWVCAELRRTNMGVQHSSAGPVSDTPLSF